MMGLLGISFNAFNIIVASLVFGLGIDYAIFTTKGLLEEYTYGRRDRVACQSGIMLSVLSTLLGFGILIFARHPALRSLSFIPLIGLLIVALLSLVVQPWLFRLFIGGPQTRGNSPWRIVNLALTAMTFGYFFIGGLLVSITARILM